MSHCPSCRHFYSSSRDECPKCKVPLEKKKTCGKIIDSCPIHKITDGRIFFRSGGVVFRI